MLPGLGASARFLFWGHQNGGSEIRQMSSANSKNYISGYIFKSTCFGKCEGGLLHEIKDLVFPGCANLNEIPRIGASHYMSHRKS
jgi:hypothetical protein